MPDPLDALPYELWICCIAFAIDGREAGPLGLLAISRRWQRALLDTPSLWNQIYVKNGKNEISRISTFLHLSGGCSLHVDIMTTPPTMDSLQLIGDHISRITRISIRPGALDTITALQMERWKQAASYVLARLSSGLLALDVKNASCFGISLWENNRLYYCIVLMQFTMATTANSTVNQNGIDSAELPAIPYSQMWEEHITRATPISADQDAMARTNSIDSFAKLASYPQYHAAIKIAIPSCIKLLRDDSCSVRSATIDALRKFSLCVELRATLKVIIPALVDVLNDKDHDVRCIVYSLLRNLAKYDEFHEALSLTIPRLVKLYEYGNWTAGFVLNELAKYDELPGTLGFAIPSLSGLLEHGDSNIRLVALSLLGKLAKHRKLHTAMRLATPALCKLIEHGNSDVVLEAVSLVREIAEYSRLREAMGLAIASLMKLLQHRNRCIVDAVSLLKILAEYDESYEALRLAIPVLIYMLGYKESDLQSAAASILEKLAEGDKLREEMRPAIPEFLSLLEHRNPNVRATASSLLGKLAEHGKSQEASGLAVPSLISRMTAGIRSAAFSLSGNPAY